MAEIFSLNELFLKLLNLESKNVQPLIDISPENIHSPMTAIPQTNEFLLSGPGGLGVFFDACTGMPGIQSKNEASKKFNP